MLSKFNGTSTPNGSYCAETGDNDCNVNSSRYSLRTALCESIRYQAKPEQNVRQDPIPSVRHGEAALCTPYRGKEQEDLKIVFDKAHGDVPEGNGVQGAEETSQRADENDVSVIKV